MNFCQTDFITIATVVSAIMATYGLWLTARTMRRQYKLDSYKFVISQMEYLDSIGARKELRKAHNQDILKYIDGDLEKEQLFKEYIYVCNRLASGINNNAIDKNIIFSLYNHQWFQEQYQNLKPIIQREETRRKRPMYVHFKKIGEQS